MGQSLFGIDIAGLINQYVASGLLDATLTKLTPGTRTGGALSSGTNPTSADYACKGIIVRQTVVEFKGQLAPAGSKEIMLGGDSIASGAIPELNDRITIEGIVYQINQLDRDPAAATYTLIVTRR